MKRIRENFQRHIDNKRLTGATYAISVKGNIICRETVGYSDCGQSVPLKDDAIFRLASMTKPITCTAAMICRERGLLDLDTPIGKYIDGFCHKGVGKLADGELAYVEEARQITLRDIFTHSSGLGSGPIGSYQFGLIKKPERLSENASAWNGRYLDFPTGSRSVYSGIVAFELAAYTVEKVVGKPFGEFLNEEIFSKLDMKDTCYRLNADQIPRLVEMPLPDNSGNIKKVDMGLRGFNAFAEGYTGGSAGLFSTLDDYLKFAQMLARHGELSGVRILSEESVDEMSRTQFAEWGLSMYVRGAKSEKQPLPEGSYGWSGAYGTHFWVEPKSETVAVLMLNHGNCGGSNSPFSAQFERLSEAALADHGI